MSGKNDKDNAGGQNPNEGEVFDKDVVFVCIKDCILDSKRYRVGGKKTGKKCPPHFTVGKALSGDEDKK